MYSSYFNRRQWHPKGSQSESRKFAGDPNPTEDIRLEDIGSVEKHLPAILGRALARSWIDESFSDALLFDPKSVLANHGVHISDSVEVKAEVTEHGRQRIIVYVRQAGEIQRLMCLQLALLAGR